MAIVAGSAVKLAAEHSGEGLLRDVAQIHGDIKDRPLGGSQRFRRQQQAALANIVPQRHFEYPDFLATISMLSG